MHKGASIGIIIAAVVIGIALASPLFSETEVNEPLPIALEEIDEDLTFEKFIEMKDEKRQMIVEEMSQEVKDMIMDKASTMIIPISETMNDMTQESNEANVKILKNGTFEGLAGHSAEGIAKIIQVNDMTFLRFENFQVTNGPDLRVYLTTDGDIHSGIHLEKLKGSKGDQNYSLNDIDVSIYDIVVIYCQPFGVYFGQAELV